MEQRILDRWQQREDEELEYQPWEAQHGPLPRQTVQEIPPVVYTLRELLTRLESFHPVSVV